jgi:hypothetical protein
MWAKRPALHSSEPGKPRRLAYAPRAGTRSRAIRGWTFQSVFSGSAMRLWRFPGSCVPRFVDAHTRSRGSAPLATAAYAHQKCVKNGSPKGSKDTPRRTVPLSVVRSTLNVSPACRTCVRGGESVSNHNQLIRVRTLLPGATHGRSHGINRDRAIPVHLSCKLAQTICSGRRVQTGHRVDAGRIARHSVGLSKVKPRCQGVSQLPGVTDQDPLLQASGAGSRIP